MVDEISLCEITNLLLISHMYHGKLPLGFQVMKLMGDQGREFQVVSLKEKDVPEVQYEKEGSVKTPPTLPSAYDCCDQTRDLEVKGNRNREKTKLLDTLSVEKESGITIKVRTESIISQNPMVVVPDRFILLNMVDTPRYTDF